MFTDGTTPDGYQVNQDGAWLDENGKVQERPGQGYTGLSGQNRASGSTQTSSGGSSGGGSGTSSSGSSSSSGGSGSSSNGSGAAALMGPVPVQALLPEIRTAVHHLLVLQMDRMNSKIHFCWKARPE